MSAEGMHATNGGSRDCGRFFLDVVGRYNRDQVKVAWIPAAHIISDELQGQIDQTWQDQADLAARTNVKLYDGPLCRLLDFRADTEVLELTLGPTGFKQFLGTNLTHSRLRYVHGPEVLANPLGVSAAVTTSDGFLILGRRSRRVIHNADKLHPIGGMVEPTPVGSPPPDPFAAILAELQEETNVTADAIRQVTCMGLVRDKHVVQPEMIFDVGLSVDAHTLSGLARQAVDADEHESLILLMNYPSSVVAFLEKHTEILTPVAVASLLLHGLHAWGSGWFTSVRGYLRSVV